MKRELGTKSISALPLTDVPPNDPQGSRDEWLKAPSSLKTSERARLEIRLNLRQLKADLVQSLETMAKAHPPTQGNLADLPQAYDAVADAYLEAVDTFLQDHPGARPLLGSRNFIADATGLQDEFNAPWCADWAGDMLKSVAHSIPPSSPASKLFRFEWGQTHASWSREHNYLIVYPYGHPPKFPAADGDTGLLLFDPWRTILPQAYFPKSGGRWYETPSNLGLKR